jgi:two-component system, OmpR family, sensor histidine kinase BaeS
VKSYRSQLILSHLLPLIIVLPLLGVIFITIVESQILLTNVVDDLQRTAVTVAAQAAAEPIVWQDAAQAQPFIEKFRSGLQRDVILLQPDGSSATLSANDLAVLRSGQPLIKSQYSLSMSDTQAEAFAPVFNAQQVIVGIVQVTDRLGDVYQGFQRIRNLVILSLLGAFAVAVIIAWWLAQRTERRLQDVTHAVEQVADGQTPALTPKSTPREFRGVLHAVQALSDRLKSSEETRKRLLANLVHELGRPLASLQAAIHALQQGAAQDASLRDDLLHGMDDQVERLKPLLDNLARLYKQSIGPAELQREPIELSKWLPQILITWQAAAQAKGLQWRIDVPMNLPIVSIDPNQMAQVVGNLVANAIQYTSSGRISIEAGRKLDRVWIAVEDTGSGIAPEVCAHIFDPFYRGVPGQRFPQGMGLGLAIARDIARAHGGDITVQSVVGQGSRFTIDLSSRQHRPKTIVHQAGDDGQ